MAFIGLVAAMMGITGCATPKSSFAPVPAPSDKALVYLYWPQRGTPHTMCVNELPVVELDGREYCPLVLDPGFVLLSHQFKTGPAGVFTGIMHDLELQLRPGKTYYVAYRYRINPFSPRKPMMTLIDETTATTEIAICTMKKPMAETFLEPGPQGTIAYYVEVESSEPGVRIEANKEYIGRTPLKLRIFGDKDGSFHNFGMDHYEIQAYPEKTNQFKQVKVFRTGRLLERDDRIPSRIYFDMNQRSGPSVDLAPR